MAPPYSRTKIPPLLLRRPRRPDLPRYSISSLSSTVVEGNRSLNPLRGAVTDMTIPEGTGTGIRKILPEDGIPPFHVSYPIALTSTDSVPKDRCTTPAVSEIPMNALSAQMEAPLTGRPDVSDMMRSVCDTEISSKSSCIMKKPPATCARRGGLAET